MTCGVMESNQVVADGVGKLDEKQNVNVIFVPESILLALSKSTEGPEEISDDTIPWRPEDNIIDNQANVSTETFNENDYLKTLSSTSQQSSFFVLDPGEWFVGTDVSGSENGIIVLPKLDGSTQPMNTSTVTFSPAKSAPSKTDNSMNEKRKDFLNNPMKIGNSKESSNKISNQREGLKKFKCPALNCGKCFTTVDKLEIHTKTHSMTKPHPCPVKGCTWSFSTPYKLRRHEQSHKQSKLFKCTHPGCNVSCSTKYNLKVHAKFHEEEGFHRCEHCSSHFRSRMKLVKHLRTVHEAQPMYKCPFSKCDKRFHTVPAQKVHEKWHRKGKFICGVEGCGRQFSVISGFRQHYKTVHSGDRPFKCDYPGCKWEFSTNSNLRRHAITHTDNKNFACPMPGCLSRFYRKEHLRSHLRVHRPENESKKQGADLSQAPIQFDLEGWDYYFCPYEDCGSLFTTLAGAKQHILKTHATPAAHEELSNKNPSPKETAPEQCLSVLPSEVDGVSGDANKMPIEIVSTEVAVNQCEVSCSAVPTSSTSQAAAATQSILQTLMEAEPSTELATNETINTSTLQATLSSSSFIPTSSQPMSVNLLTESQAVQTSAPATTVSIDPSQFLLDSNIVFTPATACDSQDPDAAKFFSLQQSSSYSSQSAIPDGFLSFNDCVQTVDPNVVMSLHSAMPEYHVTAHPLSSTFETSDEESGLLTSGEGDPKSSGSARTNYIPYLRRKTSKILPVRIQEGRSGEVRGKTFVGFEPTASAFSFNEKASGGFCNVADKEFVESTINLRDLA